MHDQSEGVGVDLRIDKAVWRVHGMYLEMSMKMMMLSDFAILVLRLVEIENWSAFLLRRLAECSGEKFHFLIGSGYLRLL